MNWWQAIILGLVEGVSEYLPISSTGHLLLTQRLLGIADNDASKAYAICIQAGAILAVVGLYYRRMIQMLRGLLGKETAGRQLAINLIVAFGITAALALTLEKPIKKQLFGIGPVTLAWMVGGLVILLFAYLRPKPPQTLELPTLPTDGRPLESLTCKQSAMIGLAQALAMWPGTSRSLVTLLAGIFIGLSTAAAVEFSFLLGVITLLAATAKDLKDHHQDLTATYSIGSMLLGVLVAGISAAAAVKWMVTYLRRHSLAIFGWYRLILAAIVGLLMILGYFTK